MDFQAYIIDASVIISIFHYKLDKNKKQDDIYFVDDFQSSVYYQCIIGKRNEWDIETELKDELYKLRECRSDVIFYLDVTKKNVYDRKNNDRTRNRSTFEEQFKLVETEKDWYKQFPVTYVDTNRLIVDDLEVYFMDWLKERGL